jgi:Na+-driven multidrug efflux pump
MLMSIIKVSVPSMIAIFLGLLMEVVNTIFVGHLGNPIKLAGIGIGNLAINMIAFSVINGFNGAIETFVPRAFG